MKEGERDCNIDSFRPLSLAGSKNKIQQKPQAGSSAKAGLVFVPVQEPQDPTGFYQKRFKYSNILSQSICL
jgi:hypothetical protein